MPVRRSVRLLVADGERGRGVSASSLSVRIARVRPAAIEANVRRLAERAGSAALCAVVKADGYGHGAVTAARAALAGGASWLAVATIREALEVAETADSVGSDAPVLILAEADPGLVASASGRCSSRVRFTVASVSGIQALAAAGGPARSVHLKVDTGMHRMGALPGELGAMVEALREAGPRLRLEGVWTHFAVADEPDDPFTAEQLRRFDAAIAQLGASGVSADVVHAANSAGLLAHPDARRDMVRAGISIYGVPPSPALKGIVELEPALELVSRVTAVRTVAPGETVSYGRHWRAGEPTRVATVAIGYADGIRRDSGSAGVEVLVRGRRCPIVGAVTMDQLMVALPPVIADEATMGDEAVLIGRQGADEITATEVAQRLGTIAYEVLTSISARVPRVVV
ncbi:MAG: alanine racemase [Acidimicrobiaceae bacterium]|nr:alanine racemase [Acidimicrobiaceae bacterium]